MITFELAKGARIVLKSFSINLVCNKTLIVPSLLYVYRLWHALKISEIIKRDRNSKKYTGLNMCRKTSQIIQSLCHPAEGSMIPCLPNNAQLSANKHGRSQAGRSIRRTDISEGSFIPFATRICLSVIQP